MIARARILPGADRTAVRWPAAGRAHRIPQVEVDACRRAQRRIADAREVAARIRQQVEKEVADLRLQAETRARADAANEVAAQVIALTAREVQGLERQRDQMVQLARLMAERLLGEQLRLAPELVVSVASQVLEQARGARRVRLLAHPDDAPVLQRSLERLKLAQRVVEVVPAAELGRGDLRAETEIGVLDAQLAPQLERLAEKLREALES